MKTSELLLLLVVSGSGWIAALIMWVDSRRNRVQEVERQVAVQVKAAIGDNIMNLVALTNTANEALQRVADVRRQVEEMLSRAEEAIVKIELAQRKIDELDEDQHYMILEIRTNHEEAMQKISDVEIRSSLAMQRVEDMERMAQERIETLEREFQERLEKTTEDLMKKMPDHVSQKLAHDMRLHGLT